MEDGRRRVAGALDTLAEAARRTFRRVQRAAAGHSGHRPGHTAEDRMLLHHYDQRRCKPHSSQAFPKRSHGGRLPDGGKRHGCGAARASAGGVGGRGRRGARERCARLSQAAALLAAGTVPPRAARAPASRATATTTGQEVTPSPALYTLAAPCWRGTVPPRAARAPAARADSNNYWPGGNAVTPHCIHWPPLLGGTVPPRAARAPASRATATTTGQEVTPSPALYTLAAPCWRGNSAAPCSTRACLPRDSNNYWPGGNAVTPHCIHWPPPAGGGTVPPRAARAPAARATATTTGQEVTPSPRTVYTGRPLLAGEQCRPVQHARLPPARQQQLLARRTDFKMEDIKRLRI
ncbi:hypothetical protein MSG28_004156 [Choristoneura fumiferana]|uniref:Uncharacterized protein n=1 Tax=Choristoneura fumiferana TaxID=7141 RepID=A0ACC0KIC7_CHOFU|nr:hypothetical protein MSG28_004156 [Choristoneura fumiferana]